MQENLQISSQILKRLFHFRRQNHVLANHGANPAIQAEFGTAFETYEAKSLDFKYADALKDYIDLMVKYSPDADKPEALVGVDYDSAMGGSFCIGKQLLFRWDSGLLL